MARWHCRHPWSAVGYFAYGRVGTGFLPRMDEGGFVIDYHTAPGTSLTETNRELEQIEAILKNDPNVYTFSRRTGAGFGGDFAESYQGDFFVRLVDPSRRPPIWTVRDDLNRKDHRQGSWHQFRYPSTARRHDRRHGRPPQPIVIELSAE